MSSTTIPKVVPAHLSFLAIYNPGLGQSDETFHNQIVFYYSKAAKARSKIRGSDTQAERELKEQENEKLRQVGLAQGMVGFARYAARCDKNVGEDVGLIDRRSFSNDAAVDSVETQKSRIVLHELEEGWWILAVCHWRPCGYASLTKSSPSISRSSPHILSLQTPNPLLNTLREK